MWQSPKILSAVSDEPIIDTGRQLTTDEGRSQKSHRGIHLYGAAEAQGQGRDPTYGGPGGPGGATEHTNGMPGDDNRLRRPPDDDYDDRIMDVTAPSCQGRSTDQPLETGEAEKATASPGLFGDETKLQTPSLQCRRVYGERDPQGNQEVGCVPRQKWNR